MTVVAGGAYRMVSSATPYKKPPEYNSDGFTIKLLLNNAYYNDDFRAKVTFVAVLFDSCPGVPAFLPIISPLVYEDKDDKSVE